MVTAVAGLAVVASGGAGLGASETTALSTPAVGGAGGLPTTVTAAAGVSLTALAGTSFAVAVFGVVAPTIETFVASAGLAGAATSLAAPI